MQRHTRKESVFSTWVITIQQLDTAVHLKYGIL